MKFLHKLFLALLCASQGVSPVIAQNISLLDELTHVIDQPKNTIFIDGWFEGSFAQDIPGATHVIEMSKNMSITFYDLLHTLEENQHYWQDHKTHSIKYFFARSPQKWFGGKSHQQEINDNLLRIDMLITILERSIDALTKYLSTFDQLVDQAQKKLWLSGLMNVMYSISLSFNEVSNETLQAKSECFVKMRFIEQYKELKIFFNNGAKRLNGQVKLTGKPNILMRNWVPTMVFGAAAIAGGYYYYNNPDKVHGFVQNKVFDEYPKEAYNLVQRHVIEPFYSLLVSVFPEKFQKINDASLTEVVPSAVADMAKKQQMYSEKFAHQLKKQIYDETTGEMRWENYEEVMIRIDEELSSTLQGKPGIVSSGMENFQDTINKVSSYKPYGGTIKETLQVGYDVAGAPVEEGVKYCVTTSRDLANILYESNDSYVSVKAMPKKFDLLFSMGAMVPAYSVVHYAWSKGIKGTYNYFTKKDLQSVRYNFKRVHDELNEHGHDNYGRLLYRTFRLKKAIAQNIVASKTHERQDCLKDIAYLESRDVSVKQKKKKLEIMMNYYSFLSSIN